MSVFSRATGVASLGGVEPFNLAVIPGSPALVPELAPRDEAASEIVDKIRALASAEANMPIEIIGSTDPRWRTELTGSFRAWGADTTVGSGNDLAELVARYCLGEAESRITGFRGRLHPINPDALSVVVLDGPAGLTQRAPLAFIDAAPAAHEALIAFLDGRGELPAGLREAGVVEPELWEELGGVDRASSSILFADSTHGVGRYVAAWQVSA